MKTDVLKNSKGISILFLVIALMLMITIGYVFSYLIPTKQKSVSFAIHSTKAFFLAQSGIEFAIRYAVANNWTTPANLDANINNVVRTLGDLSGQFTVNYDRPTNSLTSTGVIPNVATRVINVSNFTSFLITPNGLILDPMSPTPCGANGTTTARFYIRNASNNSITLDYFSATWSPNRRLASLSISGVSKWTGNRASNANRVQFNATNPPNYTYTIASNASVYVDLTWNNNLTGTNFVITFYTGATGNGYIFYLDPAGGGMRGCP